MKSTWLMWIVGLLGGAATASERTTPSANLHPLSQAIGPGEIHFTIRAAAVLSEDYAVESVYRPRREWDVKKSRHFGFLSGWMGGTSSDLIKTQREEFHTFRQQFTATNTDMTFTVPLRDPDPAYKGYQLDDVRVVGRITGTLNFDRWFPETPTVDPGYGLRCDPTTLRGEVRRTGLAAHPLRGSLPLWPTLREVDVTFRSVHVPLLWLFESSRKHHWDGWRKTSPESWPGGQTIVLRHTNAPTVWRENQSKEWEELEESLPETDRPLTVEMAPTKDDSAILRITRNPGFTEPWLCLFLTPYDNGRRHLVTSLLLSPQPWTGKEPQ